MVGNDWEGSDSPLYLDWVVVIWYVNFVKIGQMTLKMYAIYNCRTKIKVFLKHLKKYIEVRIFMKCILFKIHIGILWVVVF